MLYLSTVLLTVSYIIAIIILWQQQPCIRIRFVLSIILFIFLLMILLNPSLLEGVFVSECKGTTFPSPAKSLIFGILIP